MSVTDDFALQSVKVAMTPWERFDEFLQARGKRITRQRRLIVEQVYASHEHFDADQLIDLIHATPEGAKQQSKIHRIDDRDVSEAESWIDEVDGANPPLHAFIMPAGTELASRLHLARTVCRRAERAIISLSGIEPVGDPLLRYMNRLSDLLFAMARRANHERGQPDVPWTPSQR